VWRKLPGGWAWKTLESLVLIAVISATLIVVVFPWVEPKLPFSGNTVSGDTDGPAATPSPTVKAPSPTDVPSGKATGPDVLPGD